MIKKSKHVYFYKYIYRYTLSISAYGMDDEKLEGLKNKRKKMKNSTKHTKYKPRTSLLLISSYLFIFFLVSFNLLWDNIHTMKNSIASPWLPSIRQFADFILSRVEDG